LLKSKAKAKARSIIKASKGKGLFKLAKTTKAKANNQS